MPKAIELMRKREDEILEVVKYLAKVTRGFTSPKLILIGGYALRAFIRSSRYTRDCDFILKKRNGWHLDFLREFLPKDWNIENFEKRHGYGFMRWLKYIPYNKTKIRVSIDFMEGEIRGREEHDIVLIDDKMINQARRVQIIIGDEKIEVFVPDFQDYLIMKFISCRASDIRDIASLIFENGVPVKIKQRIQEVVPRPEIFYKKLKGKVIPEIKRKTFLDSWKGIMATTEYTEGDVRIVLEKLENLSKLLNLEKA